MSHASHRLDPDDEVEPRQMNHILADVKQVSRATALPPAAALRGRV